MTGYQLLRAGLSLGFLVIAAWRLWRVIRRGRCCAAVAGAVSFGVVASALLPSRRCGCFVRWGPDGLRS